MGSGSFFHTFLEVPYIKENPCARIKRLKQQKKIIYPLDDNEIKQLLNACKNYSRKSLGQRNLTMFSMMLDMGLRISEVSNLKNKDILENQIIIRNSKNGKDRALAITPILKKQMIKYNRVKRNDKNKNSEYYFLSSREDEKLDEKSIFVIMQTIKKHITLRPVVRFSPHTLRHTYPHMQMRNGMDIYTLSKNMGHSSVTMTQNYLQTLKSDDFVKESIKY